MNNIERKQFDAGTIFSGKPSGTQVWGFNEKSEFTPTIDENYQFHSSSRDVVVWFLMEKPEPLYVYGPVGCGKSSLIRQLSARLNYPVFEITGHGRLEFADLIGHLTVKDGNMSYEYGPLALAMRYGGILLFNEIDLTAPEVATGLNSVLDGTALCIPENGGELIHPHPMFRFIGTANTNGSGDETGLYQGTQRQNLAWLDRFMLCEMDYPSAEVEISLLKITHAMLPDEVIKTMVNYANEVRKLFMGESLHGNINSAIEVTFSTRTLLRWAELTYRFQPLASQGIQPVTYALDRALGYRASRETRVMLHELAQRLFSKSTDNTTQFLTPDTKHNPNQWEQRLAKLITADLSAEQNLPIITLQKSTTAGGKFWKAELQVDAVSLTWGKLGTQGQNILVELPQCTQANPVVELMNRVNRKIKSGYSIDTHNTKL